MKNISIYCLCLNNELLTKVKHLNYIPVGLGDNNFSNEWLRDSTKINVSKKNPFYGEYSFHYWLWKNHIHKIENDKWIGFCTYRRFWNQKNQEISKSSFNIFKDCLQKVPKDWENYETVLANKIDLTNLKWMKVLKYGKLALLRNPKAIFKSGRSIRFHFDMFHGNGVLDKAIELLNKNDREDFKKFVQTNTSFNQCNLFICKSKKIIIKYYETIFLWFEKLEKYFGFDLEGYSKIRVYAFLSERFLPYWFMKNSKCIEWPITFKDLNQELILK
jgi:hypothetical protein